MLSAHSSLSTHSKDWIVSTNSTTSLSHRARENRGGDRYRIWKRFQGIWNFISQTDAFSVSGRNGVLDENPGVGNFLLPRRSVAGREIDRQR